MAKVDPHYILQGLIKRGYSPAAAAGMVGNAAQESGFNTSAIGDGGQAMGLWQWNGPRKAKLLEFSAKNNLDPVSPDAQMDYLHHELSTNYRKTQKLINSSEDPRHAALLFSNNFERPNPRYANNEHRMGAAQSFFRMINPIKPAMAEDQPSEELMNKYQAWKEEKQQPKELDPINQGLRDIGGGVIEGVAGIGSNLLRLVDKSPEKNLTSIITGNKPKTAHEQRMEAIKQFNKEQGANPENLLYGAGEIGAQTAATWPVAGIVGGAAKSVPYLSKLAPAIASSGGTGNVLSRVLGGGISGTAQSALINPDEALKGGLAGALFGGAGGIVSAAAKKAKPLVESNVRELAKKAEKLGIEIPVDRIVNNKPLNAIASSLDYVPFSGRAATESKMQSQLNKALSKTFGQDSDNVTMALRKAHDELGAKFENTLIKNKVKVDDKFMNDLISHIDIAEKELGSDGANIIKKQVDEILAKSDNGIIDGKAAYNIKKSLDRISKRNSPEAYYADDLKNSLMSALDRSMGKEGAEGFKELRKQYGNMITLRKLAKNGVEGDVSIASIANMKNIRDKNMQDLADIAAQFLKSREGQHGAAQRAVTGAVAAGVGGGVPGLAATIAAGRGVNSALNSKTIKRLMLEKRKPNAIMKALRKTVPVLAVQ